MAGEVAQHDFWFPDIEFPVGFGQPHVVRALDPDPHRRRPVLRLVGTSVKVGCGAAGDLLVGRLLIVDWVPEHGVWGDGLMFIFDGGHLDDAEIAAIRLPADELAAFKFLTVDEALPLLKPSMARRLQLACRSLDESVAPTYSEFGREP